MLKACFAIWTLTWRVKIYGSSHVKGMNRKYEVTKKHNNECTGVNNQ